MRSCALALLTAVGIVQAADATPIDDVGPWVAKFQAAIAAGKFDEMVSDVRGIAAPEFPIDELQKSFAGLAERINGGRVDFTEVFDERSLGTFMKRVSIATRYPRGYMFYALTFSHDRSGWQLVHVTYDPDVNKILNAPWPD